jgi:hypothetical protein
MSVDLDLRRDRVDVDFKKSVIYIRRSIVKQRVGPSKPKPHKANSDALGTGEITSALEDEDDLEPSRRLGVWKPCQEGTQPYWPKSKYRVYIKRAATELAYGSVWLGTPSVIRLGRS